MTAIIIAQFIVIVILIALLFPIFLYAVEIGRKLHEELPPPPLTKTFTQIRARMHTAKMVLQDRTTKGKKLKEKTGTGEEVNPFD